MSTFGVYLWAGECMHSNKRIIAAFSIFAVTVLACGVSFDLGTSPASIPSNTPTLQQSYQDQLATIVAATLEALTAEAPTATPTSTPAPTAIPPTLSVSADTNCYAGPATSYGFVITVHPGTIVVGMGKNSAENYYVI